MTSAQATEMLVGEAIAATTVRPPHSFRWRGKREVPILPSLRAKLGRAVLLAALRASLTQRIYADFYVTGGLRSDSTAAPAGEIDDLQWLESLREANSSTGCRDDGWREVGRAGASLLVRKNGLVLRADPRTTRRTSRGLSILLPNEFLNLSPGFYIAPSRAPLEPRGPMFRVYWNLAAEGGPPFVRYGTKILNEAGLPFQLKVAARPAAFARCDAGVLYARRSDREEVFEVLETMRRKLRPYLKEPVPVFTKKIASGIAVAEEPPTARSFGESRCEILADALIRSAGETPARRSLLVGAAFARAGIPLHRAHLNPGSRDVYRPL